MKKLFAILLVTALASCVTVLEPPKINTDYKNIIGKPFKIDNIEVAQYDFPEQMNWEDAKIYCTNLGEGWSLPTIEELNNLYKNRRTRGSFAGNGYWSSTEYGNLTAWFQSFFDGYQNATSKNFTYYVRAIRAF